MASIHFASHQCLLASFHIPPLLFTPGSLDPLESPFVPQLFLFRSTFIPCRQFLLDPITFDIKYIGTNISFFTKGEINMNIIIVSKQKIGN